MSSPTLVDDTNPMVQYAPGWIWDQLVNEVDHTRHGAAIGGLTASLGFYGSGVQVVGTLEPTDHYGQPTTTYKIDGDLVGTYNAPFTASGDVHLNVTFFSKLDLSLDNHEIVITNVNGTSPNTFWLDYFLVYTQTPSPGGTTTTSTTTSVTHSTPTNTVVSTTHSTSTATSTATSSSATVVLTALASPLSTATASSSSSSSSSSSTDSTTHSFSDTATTPSESNTPTTASGTSSATGASPASGSSQSSTHSNIGKIVGGVVGGVGFLALLALVFFCLRRRRRAQDNIEPFTPQTRERSSSSGTLLGGGSPAVKTNKIPELSLASSSAATTSLTSRSYAAPSSSAMSAQPSERGAPIAASGGVSVTAGSSTPSPISPPRGLPPSERKLQESLYGPSSAAARSTLRLSQSQSQSPASDYAPSSVTTRMPADTEASRARWYAPAQEQSRAQSLLSLLSSRGRRRQVQDQDSGLRLYNEPMLPPPYTAD